MEEEYILSTKDWNIASIWWVGDEETEANAKLIAAAPDLLEVCKMFLERLHINNIEHSEDEFIKQLKKVIIKATE
jgi:hypothetical protein